MAVCFSSSSSLFFFCFYSFLLKWNWSWGGDSDRWLSALTLYPIRRRFHPIKNHLCTLKLNGSQAAERKGLPCVSELRKSNFLKAAAAVTGGKGSNSHDWPGPRLHTQFNPSQSAWHHINQPFISMPPLLPPLQKKKKKKQYFYSITSDWTRPTTHWPTGRTRELQLALKNFFTRQKKKHLVEHVHSGFSSSVCAWTETCVEIFQKSKPFLFTLQEVQHACGTYLHISVWTGVNKDHINTLSELYKVLSLCFFLTFNTITTKNDRVCLTGTTATHPPILCPSLTFTVWH